MKRKSIIAIFIAMLSFVFVFTACNGKNNDGENVTTEVGLTYTHTKTDVKWASDEAKKNMLDEMKMSETEFYNVYNDATLEVKFGEKGKAEFIYSMGAGEVLGLFYKNENGTVTFYDTFDDLKNGNVKTDKGVFAGMFKLSEDYKTLKWIASVGDLCTVTLDCTVKK